MATTTPNFGWPVPTSTDLVKNGATAIEALGDAIDASLVDLEGGTTGQVLAKASNTDMDFAWVTSDDANAIQNTIVDAKGDLIAASAADVPARLAVGSNGETLVADSSTSTGLRYNANYAAGKNAIINGAFDVWQRGTSFTASGYTADRFRLIVGNSTTVTRQTFTPGTAPVAGYEGQYFFRLARTTSTTSDYVTQKIENVQTFAGQTVTLSFWAKADASSTVTSVYFEQNFGSGGSGAVATGGNSPALTTSWTRFSYTYSIPSISGKTVGTSSFLDLVWNFGSAMGNRTIDIWGVQVEAGSVATAFQTATGTIQGELAACQRYYYRQTGDNLYANFGGGVISSVSSARIFVVPPVTLRVKPSAVDYSTLRLYDGGSGFTISALSIETDMSGATQPCIQLTSSGMTAGRSVFIQGNGSASAYLGFSAEL